MRSTWRVAVRRSSSTTSAAACRGTAQTPGSPIRSSPRSKQAGGVAVASHDSVASPEGGQAIVDTAVDRFGRLDAVVSNAGIFQTLPFDELSADDWRRMLNVHLDGSFYVSQPAFRVMKAQHYGRFVFISSSAGIFGQPLAAHYAAAKAGLVGLDERHRHRGRRARDPGEHRASVRLLAHGLRDRRRPASSSWRQSAFLQAIEPELVVPMVVFLASRACNLTHQNYSAGAGRYARVFAGLAEGWLAERGSKPTADDVAAHLAEVSATESFTIPASIFDEVFGICSRLGITG